LKLQEILIKNQKSKIKVSDALFDGNYPFFTSGEKQKRLDEYLCDGKNIFIATGGKANFKYYEGKASYSTDCLSLKTSELADTKYIFYFLLSKKEQINKEMFLGAALKHLQKKQFENIDITLPSLPEQKRIVAKLDKAFAEIDKAITITEKEKNNCPLLFQKILSSLINKISKNQTSLELGEIAKFLDYRGKTPKKSDEGIRLLTAKNVRMGFLKKQPEEFVSKAEYVNHMTRGFPKAGDVIFTTEAPLALVSQIEDDSCALGQRLITFQIMNNVIKNAYLKFILMSEIYQKIINDNGTGATVKGIKASLLKKIILSFPTSIDEQKNRVAIIEDAERNCNQLQICYANKISALLSLKTAILKKELQSEAA